MPETSNSKVRLLSGAESHAGGAVSPLSLFAPFRVLFKHRQLLFTLTRRGIEMQHKGSIAGVLWNVFSPVLLFSVYAFVFGSVFNSRYGIVPGETGTDYAIGIFFSLALAQLFLDTAVVAPTVVTQNTAFVKKVVFPLEILPVCAFGMSLFRCVISILLVLVGVLLFGRGLTWTALWLPLILVFVSLSSVGVSWLLAAFGVFLRDLNPLIQLTSVLLLFMSAVFYSAEKLPSTVAFLRFNPLLIAVESGRNAFLWNLEPNRGDIALLGLISLVLFFAGFAVFSYLKTAFADVL